MIKNKIKDALNEYLEAPEAWGDNVHLAVNNANGNVSLCEGEEIDEESETIDFWPVMDLVSMSVESPGEWEIDSDALDEMAAAYPD